MTVAQTEVVEEVIEQSTAEVLYGKEEESSEEKSEEVVEDKEESEEEKPAEEKVEEKSEEEVKDEEKPEEKKDDKDKANFELKLKEDGILGEPALESVMEFAKDHGLNKAQAQGILDKQEEMLGRYVEAEDNAHAAELKAWRKTVVSDPIIGGSNLDQSSENAKRVVERFGTKELENLLDTTGYGDHPEIVRILSSIGAVMANDSLILGGANQEKKAPKTTAELFYGEEKK